jgi:hypothetical protein
MKTFDADRRMAASPEISNRAIIFFMYLLRAISATLMVTLLLYMLVAILGDMYPIVTFPEFIIRNTSMVIVSTLLISAAQVLFYMYRLKRGANPRRSRAEIIIGYALPLIGIAMALYTAYVTGAM